MATYLDSAVVRRGILGVFGGVNPFIYLPIKVCAPLFGVGCWGGAELGLGYGGMGACR